MKLLFTLATKSLLNRKVTTSLTVATIALSVILLIGIERVRVGAKSSFERTLSGTDLIVGARSGQLNLLLYSVFRMGNATNNVSMKTFEHFSQHKAVKWAVPISLGDSHKGYRVVGTTTDYFEKLKYAGGKDIEFRDGQVFNGVFEAVLGSEVARKLGYSIGQKIALSHGAGEVSFQDHADKPFVVVGILKPTGTPIDRSVHVSLEAIEAIHVDWDGGAPPRPGEALTPEETLKKDLSPQQITAFFVALNRRIAVFNLQREINEYPEEPMSAILPGSSLQELWQIMSVGETALFLVSALVFVCSMIATLLSLLSTLNERRREMSILRSIGVGPRFIFSLLVLESLFLAFSGVVIGFVSVHGLLMMLAPWIESQLGLSVELTVWTLGDLYFVGAVLLGAFVVGVLPAIKSYRQSLSDGLTIRV